MHKCDETMNYRNIALILIIETCINLCIVDRPVSEHLQAFFYLRCLVMIGGNRNFRSQELSLQGKKAKFHNSGVV